MKIAVWHNLPSGGGKRALYHHVKGLVARGHTVESWCPTTADQTYLPLNEIIPEHITLFSWQPKKPKNALERLTADYFNIVEQLKAIDKHCQQCAEEINARGFDVLLANPCTFFRTTPICRYVSIPKVIYVQEPYRWLYEALPQLPWMALPPPKTAWWSKTYLSSFLKDLIKVQGLRIQLREEYLNAKGFDKILVNSLFSRESVLRAYGLEAKVCYLGIDTELFKPTGVAKENIVVGLGGIYIGKFIDRAIKALGTIEKNIRPGLIWIGNFSDRQYQKKMENLAATMEVKITFKVGVTDEEIVDWLNRSTALIYTPQLEPFGFAPLEANACETPVVAIAEGGIRETVRDGINGFLINDDNPVALGEAITRLLKYPDEAKKMGKKAREYVLKYWTWEQALEQLESHLLSL